MLPSSISIVSYDNSSSSEDSFSDHEEQSPGSKKRVLLVDNRDSGADESSEEKPERIQTGHEDDTCNTSPPESTEPTGIARLAPSPFTPKKRQPYSLTPADLPRVMTTFLAEVTSFFTRSVNLERQSRAVSPSTFTKVRERILCFLGFLKTRLAMELIPEHFLRVQIMEQYFDFLREERQLSPATIANHASSLLYPIKFLHREHAPNYNDVPVIRQLRAQATIFQKEGDLERPSTKEELTAQNKWLEWEQIVQACGLQRTHFEMAVHPKDKARCCCDLVILALYVFIPPSRGLEIRTLEIEKNWQTFDPQKYKGRNVILVKDPPEVSLHFNNYKTHKYTGHDELTLEGDHELCHILIDYVKNYRQHLLGKDSGNTLLLNRNGDVFSNSAFSSHIKSLFYKLTGTHATVHILRSAFVTWAHGQGTCSDALKESVAASLRHSRAQAERTYDRRMAVQKKAQAMSIARDFAEKSLEDPEPSTSQDRQEDNLHLGQFVGLVEDTSSLDDPKVLVGQIHSFFPDGNVSLLWFKDVGGGVYKLKLDGQWIEDRECLVPVKLNPLKSKPGCYRLSTSKRTIHKAVMK